MEVKTVEIKTVILLVLICLLGSQIQVRTQNSHTFYSLSLLAKLAKYMK